MAYFSQSGAPVLPHARIKKHINSPEGRYVLLEEACYIHPHGRNAPCKSQVGDGDRPSLLESPSSAGRAPTVPFKRPQTGPPPERTYLICNVGKELRYYEYGGSSRESLELVVGFASGDILYRTSPSKTHKVYNREGVINNSRVMCIKWVPGSRDLFMHGHEDGSVYVSSKDRADPSGTSASTAEKESVKLPHYGFSVYHPKGRANPISRWRVGKGAVNEFAFSPDGQLVAIVSRDGCLRIVNVRETGGEDDLVSVWSFEKRQLVARGEGHGSWVSAVAFDPWMCDANSYRFGSVGLDQRLLLWDFSANTLHKPKVPRATSQVHPPSDAATPIKSLPRLQASTLEPLSSTLVHGSPLTGLEFHDDALLTACQRAEIRVWSRPGPDAERSAKPAKESTTVSMLAAAFMANLANPTSTQPPDTDAYHPDTTFSINPAVSAHQPANQTHRLNTPDHEESRTTGGPNPSNFAKNRDNGDAVGQLNNDDSVDYDFPLGDTTVTRTPSICPAPPDSEPPPLATKIHGSLARVQEGEAFPPGALTFSRVDSHDGEKPVRETFGMRLVDPESEGLEGTPLTGSIVINTETTSDDDVTGQKLSDDANSNGGGGVQWQMLRAQGEGREEEGLTDEEGWERVSHESR